MRYAFLFVPLTLMSISAYSQEPSPFAFKDEVPVVEQPETVVQENTTQISVSAEELSRTQREEVLLLLSEALEKAAVAGGQGVYQIDGFKRYFVIADDDVLLGEMNGSFIIKDTSRNKLEYVKSSGYVGVVTEEEWLSGIQSIVKDLSEVEQTTINAELFVEAALVQAGSKVSGAIKAIQVGKEQTLSN